MEKNLLPKHQSQLSSSHYNAIYNRGLQNTIKIARLYWRTQVPFEQPWRSHSTAICTDWLAQHNRIATRYCRTHRFDAPVPMHKVSQQMQNTKARHQQRRERDRKSMKMSPRTLSDSRRGMTAANGTTGQRELGHGTAGQRDNGENGRTGQRETGHGTAGPAGHAGDTSPRNKATATGTGPRDKGTTAWGSTGSLGNGGQQIRPPTEMNTRPPAGQQNSSTTLRNPRGAYKVRAPTKSRNHGRRMTETKGNNHR